MPITGLSTGKDIAVTLSDTNGLMQTTRAKQISWKANQTKDKTTALDGNTRHLNIPGGWEVTIDFERTSNAFDQYIANLEANYFNGITPPQITLAFSITEANGSISQYQYNGGTLSFDDGGTWKADSYVTQKLTFNFSQFTVLA